MKMKVQTSTTYKLWYKINRILISQIQQHIKRTIHHDEVGFIPDHMKINIVYHLYRIKGKNHMIISTDEKKSIWQTLTLFHDKNTRQLGIQEKYFINKGNIWKTHNWHHTQRWKTECFSSKLGMGQGYLLLPVLFKNVLRVIAKAIRQDKEIKDIQIGKEEVKLSLQITWTYM